MNKHFATIIVSLNVAIIIGFLSFENLLPPVPERLEEIVEEQKIASTRCRNCTKAIDLSPGKEKIDDKIDNNASHVKCAVTVFNNAPADKESPLVWVETEHLLFRNIRPSDAEALYAYAKKPEVAARQLWAPHKSKLESIQTIKGWMSSEYSNPWAIEEKETGRFIGTAEINHYNPDEPRVMVEYCIGDAGWGKGYELETMRMLIEFSLVLLRGNRIAAFVRCDDSFSQKILELAGMSNEGIEPDYKKINNTYVSLYHYALLRKEVKPSVIDASVLNPYKQPVKK